MGRGDKKTKKGKRFKGSYGVVRTRKKDVEITIPTKKEKAIKKELKVKKKVSVKTKKAVK